MSRITRSQLPPLGLGLASTTLGAIGLALFVLPVLSIPISGAGLLCGATGALAALKVKTIDLRLSLAGVTLCCLALIIGFAMNYAPYGYATPHSAPDPVISVRQKKPHYVPPPAPFTGEILVPLRR